MKSTPAHRAATRDYWTSPAVVRNCRRLDYALGLAVLASLMLLGSLFN